VLACSVRLGAVLRSSAGAIATLFGLLLHPDDPRRILPQTWQNRIAGTCDERRRRDLLPAREAAASLRGVRLGVFCATPLLRSASRFVLITRRDA